MTTAADTTFTRSLEKAAVALETIEACRNHRLEPNAKKFALLADTMQQAAKRFKALAAQQSVYTVDDFFRLAFERLSMMRTERAAVMKFKREQREAAERERALLMGDEAVAAA